MNAYQEVVPAQETVESRIRQPFSSITLRPGRLRLKISFDIQRSNHLSQSLMGC